MAYFWPVLVPCYNLSATAQILPSWCYYLNSTIKALLSCILQIPTRCFCPDPTFPMPYCWIKWNGSQNHIICTYFFQLKWKKESKIWWEKFQNDRKNNGPSNSILMLPSRWYISIHPSRCYCSDATITMLPTNHYRQYATILTLPLPHHYPDTTLLKLPS